MARIHRQKLHRAILEALEPRQLLSATFLNAIGLGTTSPYGQSISGMAADAAGNIYVAGCFQGTMDVDPTAGVHNITATPGNVGGVSYDIFLMKFTGDGQLVWADTFGSSGMDMGADLKVDPAGNLIMTGTFSGTVDMDPGAGVTNMVSAGGLDTLIAKFDSEGQLLWAGSIGGAGDDLAGKITPDNKGGYILTGNFQETADLDPGAGVHNVTADTPRDMYMARIDSSGNLKWADTFTAPISVYFANIAVDKAGNIFAAGSVQGTADLKPGPATRIVGTENSMLGFVAKYTPSGKLVWTKQFGQGAQGILMYDMTLDVHGNIVLAGSFGGSGDFNPGLGVHTLTEHQSPDAFTGFVMKLSPTGGFTWAGAILGESWWSDAFGVATDSAGSIYITGELNDVTDFDITGTGTDTMGSRGQDDAFLAKYDGTGRLAWVETMGSTGYDHGMHVVVAPGGRVYASGYFNDTAHFGPADAGTDLTALGVQDSFIVAFDQTPTATTATLAATQLTGHPGKPVLATATVTAAQGVPTGKVVFRDGTRIVGTAIVDATGHAVVKIYGLRAGAHHLTATYVGEENFAGAISDEFLMNVITA